MNSYTNTNSKAIFIGIDYSYGYIKTVHTCFKTGVAAYPTAKAAYTCG